MKISGWIEMDPDVLDSSLWEWSLDLALEQLRISILAKCQETLGGQPTAGVHIEVTEEK